MPFISRPSSIYSLFLQYLLSPVTCLFVGFHIFLSSPLIGMYRSYLFLPNKACPHLAI